MNTMRNWICCFVAAALAAFALSSAAAPPPKRYSYRFEAFPTYDTSGQVLAPVLATFTVRNDAPPGTASSNISSFRFGLSGFTVINVAPYLLSCPGAACTLDPATNTVSVTNLSPIQGGNTYTVAFYVSSCGDGAATNINVYTGSGLNGQQFAYFDDPAYPTIGSQNVLCGDVACGETFVVPDSRNPGPTQPAYVAGLRSAYNTDGTCATINNVSYFATNTIAYDRTLQFRWHVGNEPDSQPNAAFLLTFNTGSTQPPNPRFAWRTDAFGVPQYIASPLVCQSYAQVPPPPDKLPAPLGTLNADVAPTDKAIKVDTSTAAVAVPTPPFAVLIADADDPGVKERLLVTKISGQTWSVTRGDGNTTPASHLTGQSVIITYLPLLPDSVQAPYAGGTPAQMCLQELGTYGDGTTFFKYLDSGDGWAINN